MRVSGVCYVCSNEATTTCESCGRPVCERHIELSTGECNKCSQGTVME